MTEPVRIIASRPGVPTATRSAPPLAAEQLVEITGTILDPLVVGFDLPPDIKPDGAEGRPVPIRHGVTVIVQASGMEIRHDPARRMRHQQGISNGFGPQREQVSA